MVKSVHLFSYSEAYLEQMCPIPSSNGSLDIALSNVHIFGVLSNTPFRPSTQQNWPLDRKLTHYALMFGKSSCGRILDL